MHYWKEQKKKIDEKEKQIKKIIPELTQRFNLPKHEQEAQIYRGIEGIKAILEDMLHYKINYFIGGGGYVADRFPYYWPGYNRRRIKPGVKWKNLGVAELKQHTIIKEKLMEARFLPKQLSGIPNVIWIYGDNTVNVLWSDKPIAFLIKDKQIANNYRKYFDYLWETAKK